jgi:hypothetical protein
MDAWRDSKYSMLVQDTGRESTLEPLLSKKQGIVTPEQRSRTFHRKVLKGDLPGAVRYTTEREMGGVLLPDDDKCSKTGLPIADILESKHPHTRSPDANALPYYEHVSEFIEVDVTEDAVEKTARKLPKGAGLGGVDSYTLKHWLLGFGGRVSRALRNTVANFMSWLANDILSWAAMAALRAGRLIALEKNPGVRPVGIGETWSRLFSKTVLLLTLDEPKAACGADQLCSGLEAGIEGAIHTSASSSMGPTLQ